MLLYRFNLEDHRFIADRGVHECIDEEHAKEAEMDVNSIARRRSHWLCRNELIPEGIG